VEAITKEARESRLRSIEKEMGENQDNASEVYFELIRDLFESFLSTTSEWQTD
jgi:hypothetical protein